MNQKGTPNELGQGLIFLIVGILIVAAIAGGAFYFGRSSILPSPTPVVTQIPPPSQAPADEKTANWKTFNTDGYNFKHPSNWNVIKTDYLKSTRIDNENQTVSITISEGQYPYGYGGDVKFNTRNININVGDKEYSVKENIVNDKDAYVDFKLDTTKNYHILFGTGYPAGCCGKTSLDDYKSSFDTILKILSTFKFTQ